MLEDSLALPSELGNKRGITYSLESFASVLLQGAAFPASVVLWGASNALREAAGTPLPPNQQVKHTKNLEQARLALSETAYASAWNAGRGLSMEQAIKVTLGKNVDTANGLCLIPLRAL